MTGSDSVRAGCARSLSPYAPQNRVPQAATERWASESIQADVYGDGGAVDAVEHRVALLLGKPAAVFMPTGTMAQQIALRIHADRRDSRTIVFHPLCHLERNEERAFEHLHALRGCPVGEEDRLVELADLAAKAEPVAALVLELPQRMIGAQLPTWPELVAQTTWARERGAAAHLDGARLWEAQPFYVASATAWSRSRSARPPSSAPCRRLATATLSVGIPWMASRYSANIPPGTSSTTPPRCGASRNGSVRRSPASAADSPA